MLTPALQRYDWGTTDDIPRLLGLDVTGKPVAEAWWGAHPGAPAQVHVGADSVALTDHIAADAPAQLGEDVAQRWAGRLPYLLKVLAIAKPLSIQVHPSLEQAREGFDRENSQGIPLDARERTFKDASHKPEMVVALTPMTLLVGFRDPASIAADLDAVGGGHAAGLAGVLTTHADAGAAIAAYVRAALATVPSPETVERLFASAQREGATSSHRTAASALHAHPGDPGALVALAMNTLTLDPGQASYTPAGVVHSYQRGVGLEIMANSDNVVRAGLTSKPIDTDLLFELADTVPSAPLTPTAVQVGAMRTFVTPAREFSLSLVTQGEGRVVDGPRIVLCLEGEAIVTTAVQEMVLTSGQSAFVPASDGPLTVSASRLAAVASVPLATR